MNNWKEAESYLGQAREIGPCPETDIAAAFIASRKGDKAAAFHQLAHLDSPISWTARLTFAAHDNDPRKAVDWLKATGIVAEKLDADGKRLLLACYFELGKWKAARDLVDVLTDADFSNAPTLYHMAAVTHLLTAVPNELRSDILNSPPLEAVSFPLASGLAAIEARRTAREYFIHAANAARQLECPVAGRVDDEYALWLELMDPQTSSQGIQRLESELRDAKNALHLVRFGVQFGIELDLDAVEREINRQIALNGEHTAVTAIARLALAFGQKTPENRANYILRHIESLAESEYVDRRYLQFVQIELLARAGQVGRAQKHLDVCLQDGVPDEHERRLRGIIADAKGADPLERYKEQFREKDSLDNLQLLVHELETRSDWEGLCDYGETLYKKTGTLEDAVRFATALFNTQANDRLARFLKWKRDLLAQSKNLQLLFCWTLYIEGALLDARGEMAKLDADWDHPVYRTLQINLAISMGDWNSVSAFIANECREREKRNAQELITTAQLALHLDSVLQAKELTYAAVEKGNEDADILGTAYVIATRVGWEDKEVSQWIQRAAEISGDDGPIQRVSLKEFVDRKPDWERRDSEISRQLSRGDLPMYLAAQVRNTSLGGMMLFSALANLDESDPRRKDVIPGYSGRRQETPLDTGGQIGIDATALLTLSLLNVLDEALDAFETVHIPHSTLGWLFEEKQRVTFHQPSRITDAHRIRNLMDSGALEELCRSAVVDSDFAELVGDELAQFIAEAKARENEDEPQRIVVQPAPVYSVSSLMEKEVDLTAYEGVLSSCQSVVDKLRQKGQITANEEREARAYFQLNEKPWPSQPKIDEGAVLYLDDSAVYAFLHLGILGKLKRAGFKSIISLRMISEIRKLISYESISGNAIDAIERIRSAVNPRIESGKIKVSRRVSVEQPKEQFLYEHPTAGVLEFLNWCDKIVADDRVLNQNPPPMFSTLDLINALVTKGALTVEEEMESRTMLRLAGYFFVPLTEDELTHHLTASRVENGEVIETAELKAIRENVLQVRMSTWLQLPKEEYWLKTLLGVCHRVLGGLWKADADLQQARARSEWIIRLIDVRGWAHTVGTDAGEHIIKTKYTESILAMLSLAIELPPEVSDDYRRWVEERVLAPLNEQNPDAYRHLMESYKNHISHVVDKCMKGMNDDDNGS